MGETRSALEFLIHLTAECVQLRTSANPEQLTVFDCFILRTVYSVLLCYAPYSLGFSDYELDSSQL